LFREFCKIIQCAKSNSNNYLKHLRLRAFFTNFTKNFPIKRDSYKIRDKIFYLLPLFIVYFLLICIWFVASAQTTLTISPRRVRVIDDPVLQMLTQLHKIIYISQVDSIKRFVCCYCLLISNTDIYMSIFVAGECRIFIYMEGSLSFQS